MKYLVFSLLIAVALPTQSFAFDHTHAKWTKVLKEYQNAQGLVKYKKLKADATKEKSHPFNAYLSEIQAVKYTEYKGWQKNEQKAFLMNSYNALTVKLIVNHYPVKSIKDIGGFFGKPWGVEFFSLLDGKIKSLDPIEHKWLRPQFKDFRIHAAVNCASISCPPLRNEAFVASRLDAQLDDQMQAWLQDSSRNQLEGKELKVSKIFDWYGDDFEKWGGGVVQVIKKYAGSERTIASEVEVDYLDYDWGLNEAK